MLVQICKQNVDHGKKKKKKHKNTCSTYRFERLCFTCTLMYNRLGVDVLHQMSVIFSIFFQLFSAQNNQYKKPTM